MSYVVDTSALVGAWVRSYPPDTFPALWRLVDTLIASGRFIIPEEVFHELKAKDDALYDWASAKPPTFVAPTSRTVMERAAKLLSTYPYMAKSGTGRDTADAFVIATAESRNWAVVAHEEGGSADKPRIPYVCDQCRIRHLRFLDVIRAEGWTF